MKALEETLKKYLYIIYSEKYSNTNNGTYINRYVAKHPLLRPELIVVNDQIHGFKKLSKTLSTLEEFPIYLEIEGVTDEDNVCFVDAIELYSESRINCQKYLTEIIHLATLFKPYVALERSFDVTKPRLEKLTITSKIHDFIANLGENQLKKMPPPTKEITHSTVVELEEDADTPPNPVRELLIELDEFNKSFGKQLAFFIEFISLCHQLLVKKHPFEKLKERAEAILNQS